MVGSQPKLPQGGLKMFYEEFLSTIAGDYNKEEETTEVMDIKESL